MRLKPATVVFFKLFGSLAHSKCYIHVTCCYDHHFNKCVMHSQDFFPLKPCSGPSDSSPCSLAPTSGWGGGRAPGVQATAEQRSQFQLLSFQTDFFVCFCIFYFDVISDLQKSCKNRPKDSCVPFLPIPQTFSPPLLDSFLFLSLSFSKFFKRQGRHETPFMSKYLSVCFVRARTLSSSEGDVFLHNPGAVVPLRKSTWRQGEECLQTSLRSHRLSPERPSRQKKTSDQESHSVFMSRQCP